MKKRLLLLLSFCCLGLFAQEPIIEGNLMLCPYEDGTATITNEQTYDSYQWYQKYWFMGGDFEAIAGATEASFTYDWMTYDQTLLKVIVTLNGETYESNEIQIDSYAWASLILAHELSDNLTIGDNGDLFLCEGTSFDMNVGMPYNIVTWYKDGIVISGAESTTYTITEAGTYHVVAAPDFCSASTSTSLPIIVHSIQCESESLAPVIEGNVMLCPYEDGTATITNEQTYDSYQWYQKYWFMGGDFEAIDGATEASFTYDWMTYDQTLLKVVVTLNGETYESNEIQIDSYAWASLILTHELSDNLTIGDNGDLFLCAGTSFDMNVGMPYNIVTWYKDGVVISGAESTTYTITEAGTYHVVAAPDFCSVSTSTSLPVIVHSIQCESENLAPVIEGNVMLCPYEDGTATITTEQTYDSYQWYQKYWFMNEDFVAIDGATEASFTYDWMTYDQTLLKVVVTLDGETYESNEIQIDSYAWPPLLLSYDLGENVTYDHEANLFSMCEGTTMEINVSEPYTIITWYKDGEVIEGETSSSYTITEAGSYHLVAAPEFCPNVTSTSLSMNFQLIECNLSIDNPNGNTSVKLYPNPVIDNLMINSNDNISEYSIIDTTGRIINKGIINSENIISFENIPQGIYFVNLKGENYNTTHKIVKK